MKKKRIVISEDQCREKIMEAEKMKKYFESIVPFCSLSPKAREKIRLHRLKAKK